MIIFDGIAQAVELEAQLKMRAAELMIKGGTVPTIAAILFREDTGSQLYTRLKREAAARVGIKYQVYEFSLTDQVEKVQKIIRQLNGDQSITGIIVQKPWRKIWLQANEASDKTAAVGSSDYDNWWQRVMSSVGPEKDVDGLHPHTIEAIKDGSWVEKGLMLPATCQAVLFALDKARTALQKPDLGKTVILGRSDLLGLPLFYVLEHQGVEVELIGIKELVQRRSTGAKLLDADVIVSATGQRHLITGDMIHKNVVLVDVGEPEPDIDRRSVSTKASFLTPVPGGIGPLTVSFLLENAIMLAAKCQSPD